MAVIAVGFLHIADRGGPSQPYEMSSTRMSPAVRRIAGMDEHTNTRRSKVSSLYDIDGLQAPAAAVTAST